MSKIDENTLKALFNLSRFELKDAEKEAWLSDLNHWLDFFRIDNFTTPDVKYFKPISGDDKSLRSDSDEGVSLEPKEIKQFCNRFLDGFVALPKKEVGDDYGC